MALSELEKLKKINTVLIDRLERSMDQQANGFSLFQTAIALEKQVRLRTDELAVTLRRLEQTNHALQNAKEVAESANTSKTRFLAAASHDVLQPLNAANLSISALADLQATERGRNLARQVQQSLSTMDDLLRTLLDISRLDSGVMKPEINAVQLNTIFDGLRSDFSSIAAERGLRIVLRPTQACVLSDRTMLRRILQNIISNAVRYTARGGVLVAGRGESDRFHIDVLDTGIGIPANQFDAIFQEFHRGPPPPVTDLNYQAGLGLGLSIVKRMVTALGHRLAFKSIVGRGTAFRLYLPRCTFVDHPGDAEPSPGWLSGGHLLGAKVLLVENDQAVMRAMATLLESWQCLVRMASQTEEAIDVVVDGAWVPDIILADQHLDSGDLGSSTIERVRERFGHQIPAVIVTADPSRDVAEHSLRLSVEVMRKPLKPAELRALMIHLLNDRRVEPA